MSVTNEPTSLADERADESGLDLEGIGQIAIPVVDVGAARNFYQNVLGLRLLFEAPPALAFFDCGGIRLMLEGSGEEQDEHRASIIYYRVHDLHRSVETLRDRGVAFVAEPQRVATLADHELWMAFLRDPSGNLLALMAEHPLPTTS